MCEVWKWTAIVDGIPLVVLHLVVGPLTLGFDRWQAWLLRLRPYLRYYLMATSVLIVSLVMYVEHCTD